MYVYFFLYQEETNKQVLQRGFDGVMILTMCTYYNLFPTYHPSICLTPKIAVLRFSNTFKDSVNESEREVYVSEMHTTHWPALICYIQLIVPDISLLSRVQHVCFVTEKSIF